MIETIVLAYAAFLVVIWLHELGHLPKRIKFKFLPPYAAAMKANSRYGGLIVNAIIFIAVWNYRPENIFLQLVGLIAWGHFIFYTILGSIMPEANERKVNLRTYVFDDVPNNWWFIFIPLGIIAYIVFSPYYMEIIKGLL